MFNTSKSFSLVLSGRNASSAGISSPSNLDRSVLTSELALDLAVSAVELKESDLERKVSPLIEVAVGEEGTWRVSRALSTEGAILPESESAGSCRLGCDISVVLTVIMDSEYVLWTGKILEEQGG